MDYTRLGVLAVQIRVADRLKRLLAERRMSLDSTMWFDGRMDLPKPGESWKLTLFSRGKPASIELSPAELDEFMAARAFEVVSQKLGGALDSLRLER